ncbi:MAG TPA: helix-turn-helix transcriptional regulator [Candidatus Acidoferrum sp.]|nr:helix-turn-helix transcriptional regulator [Candidatus Acidoferrum sp.]
MTKDDFYQAVGARIRAARKKAGRGQKDVAAHLSLSRESISNIEAGRHALQLYVLVELAQHLGVSLTDLLPQESMSPAEEAPDARDLFKSRVLRGSS